jgi:hypothetical protein
MIETHSSRTISLTIARSPDEVYQFVSNPQNFPAWATSFCRGISQTPEGWVVDTQDGPVGLRFVEANVLGVLDHHVTLPSGQEIFGPMRVIPNGEGSEFMFTLFHLPSASQDQFARDAGLVERDLRSLKELLEADGRPPSATPGPG